MPNKLTDVGKHQMLAVLAGGATIRLQRDDVEITDGGYVPREIKLSEPRSINGKETVINESIIIFGPWEENAISSVSGWFVEREGKVIAIGEFEEFRIPRRNDELVIRIGDISFSLKEI